MPVINNWDYVRDLMMNSAYSLKEAVKANKQFSASLVLFALLLVYGANTLKDSGFGREVAEFGYSFFISSALITYFYFAKWVAIEELRQKSRIVVTSLAVMVTAVAVRVGYFSLSRMLVDTPTEVAYSLPPIEHHAWFWAHRPEMAIITGITYFIGVVLLISNLEPMNRKQISGVIAWALGLGVLMVAL